MEKCVLLIDGNWLLQSRFSVLGKFFKAENSPDTKQLGTNNLVDMMARSINVMLNRFPFIDNIILVSDGGSWRKSIEKPSDRIGVEYKGNRETQNEFDWDYIWSALKILSNNFVNNNITYSCYRDIEGDDWIWYWTRYLNNKGVNCIIWSSDNDLKQLVLNNTQTNAFVMWYNDKNGGFLDSSLDDKCNSDEEMLDFFLKPITKPNPILESVKNILKKGISYVHPSDIILSKIMCGDAGDNIKPVATYELNGRTYGLTQRMWNDISNQTNIKSIYNLLGNENTVALYISKYKKFEATNVKSQSILENIKYNIQMVWLDEQVIPSQYKTIMNNWEYKLADIKSIRYNYKMLCNVDNEVASIINEIESLFD